MDQIPATPAKVSYQGGLLDDLGPEFDAWAKSCAMCASSPGLRSIFLRAHGANERVVTHLGPGAPRDVLAVLLNGSSFNYVMVGSSSDPTAVSSVILS